MPTPPRYLTHDGLTLSIREWASRLRLDVGTIRSRLDRLGWSIAQALTTPADRRYRKADRPTSEVWCQKVALTVLLDLYGTTPAAEFDTVKLRAVRHGMIEKGWTRQVVNKMVRRVVAAFGWAAGESWIPAAVPAALREVERLKAGRSAAPDREKVKPVPDAVVEATLPFLSPQAARRAKLTAMIRAQRLTGMRPGEVCGLRSRDLDKSGDVWVYTVRPEVNKNAHRDKPQKYYLGPKVQALLTPYLDAPDDRPVFGMTRHAYGLVVRLACDRAKVERWHPHQLRHNLATEAAREAGTIDTAAGLIGDTPETAARHYVHVDPQELAKIEWARRRG